MSNVILRQVTFAIAMVLNQLLTVYWWIVIIAVLLTWVNPDPYNPIVRFLHRVTEPVLRPIRDRLPTVGMGLDPSPVVVLLALKVAEWVVVDNLRDLALSLR